MKDIADVGAIDAFDEYNIGERSLGVQSIFIKFSPCIQNSFTLLNFELQVDFSHKAPALCVATASDLYVNTMPMKEAVRRYKFSIVIDGNCDSWRLQELLGKSISS